VILLNKFDNWLKQALVVEASDIHFTVGHPPILRVVGQLTPLAETEPLQASDTEELARALMSDEQYRLFQERKDIDFSYRSSDGTRFRTNVFYQRSQVSLALRVISGKIKTIEELNLPLILKEFTHNAQGFVLITGASSQGKSTTLAALVDEINQRQSKHIITIEDPIEYIFEDKRSIIAQREVFSDAISFPQALKSTLREDPDVIVVGEMRDLETIATAITAAETGHLVFATLHTNDAAQTIHRLADVFPAAQQNQIRAQLAGSLLGIASQRLVPARSGIFLPACEVLINTPAVSNLIRKNDIAQIPLVIQTSANVGMVSMNRSLADLVEQGQVAPEKALAYSLRPNELRDILIKLS
jgi:twitching motility protein PilT